MLNYDVGFCVYSLKKMNALFASCFKNFLGTKNLALTPAALFWIFAKTILQMFSKLFVCDAVLCRRCCCAAHVNMHLYMCTCCVLHKSRSVPFGISEILFHRF